MTSNASSSPWKIIAIVSTIYLGVLILSINNPANSIKSDSKSYMQMAENFRTHHVFSSSVKPPLSPEIYRLPLYPLFLALTNAYEPTHIQSAMVLQSLMGLLTFLVLWSGLYRFSGYKGAVLGTLFLCLDPLIVLHQDLIATEAPYVLALCIALCLSLRYFENPALKFGLAAGVFFGIAALIKPVGLIPAFFFLIFTFRNWKNALWIFLFTFSLPVSWVIRNEILTGYPVYTVQGNFTLLQYTAAGAVALESSRTRPVVAKELEKGLPEEPSDAASRIALSLQYRQKALQIIWQHPWGTVKYFLIGVARVSGGTGLEMLIDLFPSASRTGLEGSELHTSGAGTLALLKAYPALIPFELANIIFILCVYFWFGKGLNKLVREGHIRLASFIIFSIVTILIVSTIPEGYYRLRIPILPFLSIGVAAYFASSKLSLTL